MFFSWVYIPLNVWPGLSWLLSVKCLTQERCFHIPMLTEGMSLHFLKNHIPAHSKRIPAEFLFVHHKYESPLKCKLYYCQWPSSQVKLLLKWIVNSSSESRSEGPRLKHVKLWLNLSHVSSNISCLDARRTFMGYFSANSDGGRVWGLR